MKRILQLVSAFWDGFLPVFGLLVCIGLGVYVYKNSFSAFLELPVIEEITDKYKLGWQETWAFGQDLHQRLVTFDSLISVGEEWPIHDATVFSTATVPKELNIPWNRVLVERKLAKQNWPKGKLRAAGAYLDYIDQYLPAAARDMYSSGVSASITLAQGILESDAGRSRLALTTNNHFGIKALPTKEGRRKIRAQHFRQLTDADFIFRSPAIGVSQHHDDHKYDRFESYYSVADSYKRHSALLLNTCAQARKGCYGWIWATFPVQEERLDLSAVAQNFKSISGYEPTDFFGETLVPYYAAQAAALKMAGYATSKTYHRKLVYLIETYELWRIDVALVQAASVTITDS